MIHPSTSSRSLALLVCTIALLLFGGRPAAADHHEQKTVAEQTPKEQVLGLEAMCAKNADAMATRQEEKSLYERLGGEEKIREIVGEVVRLHYENEALEKSMEGVDRDHLVDMVTEFLVVASGGPGEYTGKSMPEAHAHLHLTNADFLAAGGDVMQGMKNMGCGEEEIQEIACMFVSLRHEVVIESEKELD